MKNVPPTCPAQSGLSTWTITSAPVTPQFSADFDEGYLWLAGERGPVRFSGAVARARVSHDPSPSNVASTPTAPGLAHTWRVVFCALEQPVVHLPVRGVRGRPQASAATLLQSSTAATRFLAAFGT